FEPDLGKYGLGQAELCEMLRRSRVEGATEVDLRAGDFPYKRKWANAEIVTRSVAVVAPGRAGGAALVARRLTMRARARRLRRRERRPVGPVELVRPPRVAAAEQAAWAERPARAAAPGRQSGDQSSVSRSGSDSRVS